MHPFKLIFIVVPNYDNEFGCLGKQIFATGITDNSGKYTFKPGELNKANEGIILHKDSYWNTNGGTGKVYMSPEAFINVHLTRSGSYPDTSLFRIMVIGEAGIGALTSFRAPADSLVKVRAVGNETNTLSWQVITKDSHCYQYCIVDTLAKGMITENPAKFETISYTLKY